MHCSTCILFSKRTKHLHFLYKKCCCHRGTISVLLLFLHYMYFSSPHHKVGLHVNKRRLTLEKNFGFGTYGHEAGVYNWRFWSGKSGHKVKSVQDQLAILPPVTRTCLPHSTGSRRAVSECLLGYLRRFIIQNVHILPAENAVTERDLCSESLPTFK